MIKFSVKANNEEIMSFYGGKNLSLGEDFSLPGGASCKALSGQGKGIDTATIITFVLENINAISVGLFSAYIYDRIKSTKTIEINGKQVPLEKEEIEKELLKLKQNQEENE